MTEKTSPQGSAAPKAPSNEPTMVSALPTHTIPIHPPPFRMLRAFAFDPSLSTELENAVINEVTMKVHWEKDLQPGPVGDYLEVVDVDPPSGGCYEPVNLNDPLLLARDGWEPSEGNPQFHQQMVYAVAMTTIRNFEQALGRTAFWAPHYHKTFKDGKEDLEEEYVRRLRIYPHALREANAFYSPQKKALLFGYFPASTSDPRFFPGGTVFTCLSHDIVAHETTHALLDGMHRRFNEPSNPDVLAFHEAFADIAALFQHFSLPEALRHQIAKTHGDLAAENLLLQLAVEFGQATESHRALRDALGEFDEHGVWKPKKIDPGAMEHEFEPHARGSLLVAAIFDAFVSIWKSRTADLMRIATGGTGVLLPGSLHPDLVNRLAAEAGKSAQHVLTMCIRALDYCPPVDLTFGEYLRALITADYDLVQDDDRGYRLAFIESFRRRGIYPRDVRSLSVESLRWLQPQTADFRPYVLPMIQEISKMMPEWNITGRSEEIYWKLAAARGRLHDLLKNIEANPKRQALQGLLHLDPARKFEVHSLRPARRIRPDSQVLTDLVMEITQWKPGYFDDAIQKQADKDGQGEDKLPTPDFKFRGGCTLLVDLSTCDVRYSIYKNIDSENRLARQRTYLTGEANASLRATYFGDRLEHEPFALLHRSAGSSREAIEWPL